MNNDDTMTALFEWEALKFMCDKIGWDANLKCGRIELVPRDDMKIALITHNLAQAVGFVDGFRAGLKDGGR